MNSLTLSIKNSITIINNNYLIKVLFGVTLLFLFAQIVIPLKPVPITLQTVAVMFLGLTYDRKAAISSVASYLALGSIGVPVFHKFLSGFNIITGVTGGYLVGMLIAVAVMATISQKLKRSDILTSLLLTILGQLIIFISGIFWLSKAVGFKMALDFGFYPFIIPGIFKTIILITLLKVTKRKLFNVL